MIARLYLVPRDHGRTLKLAEFEAASAQKGHRYELIDGKLEVWPFPELGHEFLRGWLAERLHGYSRERPEIVNKVFGPARVFVPNRPSVLIPDIAAYRDFPLDIPVEQLRWQDVSPVLVVEILSEDTAAKDLERNYELYPQVPSVREYWVVDPRASASRPTLTVHRRRGARWQRPIEVAAGGEYTTRLLPGFSLVMAPHVGGSPGRCLPQSFLEELP
jgi:Uma2 family endonuclease